MTPHAQPMPLQEKGWLSKNWKWFAALGCLVPTMCCGRLMVVGVDCDGL
jgi:hypothetical protein